MNRRHPNLQVGDALFQSKLGELTGFGKDLFVLPTQVLGFLAEWQPGELHVINTVAQIMPHIYMKKMWKSNHREPK